MDNISRNLLDEYRETKYQQPQRSSKAGSVFLIVLSVIVILCAGVVFCANNKLLHADVLLDKIANIRLGDVTVSQLYEQVFSNTDEIENSEGTTLNETGDSGQAEQGDE